ncbi:MAG TPA: hemerythrin family protein [Verrucomicrobiae bacterium]|nr:hemerythrin family protein [Verrucomicrobiae bacterium]
MRTHVPWQDDLLTGIASIDTVHRQIFVRFNQLLAACDRGRGSEELKRLVGFLDEYVLRHFDDEEALQREVGYPHLEKHRREHQAFTVRLEALKEKVRAQGTPVYLVVEACRLLAELLFEHISVSDAAFAAHVRTVRPQVTSPA